MIRIRTIMTGVAGTPWYTNMYFDTGLDQAQATATRVDDFWTSVKGGIAASVTIDRDPDVLLVDPLTGKATDSRGTSAPVTQGTSSGVLLPPQCNALARIRTGVYVGGRKVVGKLFVPGLTTSLNTASGGVLPAFQADLASDVDTHLINPSTGAGRLGVYSPTHRAIYQATSADVWSEWASIRSRRD